jgi:putative flippase GtrA
MQKYAVIFRQSHLFRFLVVGGISTVINYGVFWLLLKQNNYQMASAAGFMTGLIVGFFLNKNWTFQYPGPTTIRIVATYISTYVLSLVLSLVLLSCLVHYFGMMAIYANIVCIVFTTCTNYAGIKLLVFQ